MNRAQRRAADKKLRSVNGYSAYKRLIEHTMLLGAKENMLEDGEKVKLNVAQITGRPEWDRLNPAYRAFVQENRDTLFTASIRRRSNGGYPVIVDLEGVETWSFWSGDLIRVKEDRSDG